MSMCWCPFQLRHCTQTVSVPITLGWPVVHTHPENRIQSSTWHHCHKYSVRGTSHKFGVLRLLQPQPSWLPIPHQQHCFLGAAAAGQSQGPCPHLSSGHPFSSALTYALQDVWNDQVSSPTVMLSLQWNKEQNINKTSFSYGSLQIWFQMHWRGRSVELVDTFRRNIIRFRTGIGFSNNSLLWLQWLHIRFSWFGSKM